MARVFLVIVGISGLLATGLGAYGAHGLPGKVSEYLLSSFNTAVLYQFLHTLALFGVGLWLARVNSKLLVWAGYCFILGTLGFSGSIYGLVFLGSKGFGPITPMGGTVLMLGWVLVSVTAFKGRLGDE